MDTAAGCLAVVAVLPPLLELLLELALVVLAAALPPDVDELAPDDDPPLPLDELPPLPDEVVRELVVLPDDVVPPRLVPALLALVEPLVPEPDPSSVGANCAWYAAAAASSCAWYCARTCASFASASAWAATRADWAAAATAASTCADSSCWTATS